MKGIPNKIATGQDVLNCLALVQSGEIDADALAEQLDAIEERAWTKAPIIAIDETRKVVTVRSGITIEKGTQVRGAENTTIKSVQQIGEGDDTALSVTLTAALPVDTEVLMIPSIVDPYEQLGTTKDDIDAVKEVLKNYAISE